MNILPITIILLAGWALSSCDSKIPYEPGADSDGHTAPTAATTELNEAVRKKLNFPDQLDFEDAQRGLIAADPALTVRKDSGEVVWNPAEYGFIEGEAPASVNPSLWRQAQLNNIHGLFEVTKGMYQLRGYDLSNMTIIEGETGWIIIDPITAKETGAAAVAMARKHLEEKPIVAMIFTHSHVDHFGGVLGVLSEEEIATGRIRVIAPEGFMQEATSENIIAGTAMSRRAMLMPRSA